MIENSGPIRIVLLEPDADAAARARAALAGEDRMQIVAIVADQAALLDKVSAAYPDVALLDLGAIRGEIGASVHELLARVPECCVIVTAETAAPSLISRAVTAGARGFLLKPYQSQDLVSTIHDAYANFSELRRLQQSERATPSPGRRGSVIAVYSPKGGVGCTTIATNLAVALAERPKHAVAIVDLDLQFGDVGTALDLRSANNISDLLAHVDSIDDALINEVFVRHSSGLRALLAPEDLAVVPSIDPDRVARAIHELRDHFDYVVCDLWSSLEDLALGTLRLADQVVLVTTPELPALRNLRRVINATATLLLDERALLVVNRMPGKAGVSAADIERGLGRSVTATIPSDGVGVTAAINQGITVLDSRARTRVSRSYRDLANLVVRELSRRPVSRARQLASTA